MGRESGHSFENLPSQLGIQLVQGDITHQEVDAIVNAANQWLAGGGGVDGAIHDAGGPAIMQELKRKYPEGCSTGDAVVTGAGKLRAKFVIHAVGPVYSRQEQKRCAQQLRQAYWNAFRLAAEQPAPRFVPRATSSRQEAHWSWFAGFSSTTELLTPSQAQRKRFSPIFFSESKSEKKKIRRMAEKIFCISA
jgi:hypothetical protein